MSRHSERLKMESAKVEEAAESWSPCEKAMEDMTILLQSGAVPKWQACVDQRGAATDGNWDSVALVNWSGEKWGPGADRRPRDVRKDVGGQIIRVVLKDTAFKRGKNLSGWAQGEVVFFQMYYFLIFHLKLVVTGSDQEQVKWIKSRSKLEISPI